eukprot:scaffold63372_cov75-Phaeocystis_antarctica.AAC.5
MPPQAWLDACHAHGVPCLATFITENGEEGESQRRPRTPRARSPDPQSLLEAWPEAYQQPTNIQSPDRPPSARPLTRRARARRVLYTTLHLTPVYTLPTPTRRDHSATEPSESVGRGTLRPVRASRFRWLPD